MADTGSTPLAVIDAFPMFRLGLFAALHNSAYEIVQMAELEEVHKLLRNTHRPLTIVGVTLKELRTFFLNPASWTAEGAPFVFVADAIEAVRAVQGMAQDRPYGILHRSVERGESIACLDAVSAGGTYVSPSFNRRTNSRRGKARSGRITHREAQIARMLHAGLTNVEIAGDLSLSVNTVDSHVKSLRQKLGVRNRTQVATMLGPDVKGGDASARYFSQSTYGR